MTKEELDKLLVRAGRYTAKYEKSPKEVAEKLRVWSEGAISSEEVEEIINALKRDKFVDEVRFTERYVRDKMISYRKGPMMIRRELMMKGIPSDVIDEELAKVEEEAWLNNLRGYLEPRVERHKKKAKNRYDMRMRMAQWAYSRGYLREQSDPVIEELMSGLTLSDADSDEYGWYDE